MSTSMASSSSTSPQAAKQASEEPEEIWQFCNIMGRTFNTKDSKFILPTDDEEFARMDLVHKILTMALDSLVACPELVRPRLAERDGVAPGVLDLGCGSGVWASEMAEEYQFAEVVGIDVQAPPKDRDVPVNCRFEIDDFNLSLAHYAHCFDVVHCRSIDFYVRDYERFLYEIARVLRPDGLVLIIYPMKELFNEKYEPLPSDKKEGEEGFIFLQHYMMTVHEAIKRRGGAEDAFQSYKQMFLANPNFDDSSIAVKELHIPVSPWPERMNEHDSTICNMMGRNMYTLCHSYRPLVTAYGIEAAEVDRWLEVKSIEGLQDATSVD